MCILNWIVTGLHEWQDLAAGVLGFSAAIFVVIITLRSEDRKEEREFIAISKALTAEVFQFATLALLAHNELNLNMHRPQGLTIHEIEDSARFVSPTIYSSIGSRIGLLGDQAHNVVLFFGRIQVFLNGVARMQRNLVEKAAIIRDAEEMMSGNSGLTKLKGQTSASISIGQDNSKDIVENLLIIAETGGELLPHLTKGTIDEVGAANFQKAVKEARSAWGPRPVDPTA